MAQLCARAGVNAKEGNGKYFLPGCHGVNSIRGDYQRRFTVRLLLIFSPCRPALLSCWGLFAQLKGLESGCCRLKTALVRRVCSSYLPPVPARVQSIAHRARAVNRSSCLRHWSKHAHWPIRTDEWSSRLSGQRRILITQPRGTTEHECRLVISFRRLYFP